MSVFDNLGINRIYSNPYYPWGNSRIVNMHNFLKHTIAKFMHGSQFEWDDALSLATYCYNFAPSIDDLECPFYLVHGRNLIKGRLSNLQNYCRYVSDQPSWLAVQQLRTMWRLHAKLLKENRREDPIKDKKITKASNLKVGQLVFVKDHHKGTFDPTYIFDHRVSGIINDSTVMFTTPDGKEKKCNIHHIKPTTPAVAFTNTFDQFQESIKKNPCSAAPHQYNLGLK